MPMQSMLGSHVSSEVPRDKQSKVDGGCSVYDLPVDYVMNDPWLAG